MGSECSGTMDDGSPTCWRAEYHVESVFLMYRPEGVEKTSDDSLGVGPMSGTAILCDVSETDWPPL